VETQYIISPDQLVAGLYVRLDRKVGKGLWKKQEFKIAGESDIAAIRSAGVETIICILERSDRMPLPQVAEGAAPPHKAQHTPPTPVSAELLGLRQQTMERNRERRRSYKQCEKRYETTMSGVVALLRRASARSSDAAEQAGAIVASLVDTFLDQRETMLTLMGGPPREETKNYHALNVTVLALMVGKDIGLPHKAMTALGMGALFHDIGKGRLPMHIASGKGGTSMNRAIAKFQREHPILGARLVEDFADYPQAAVDVVRQHHEAMDGSGYPEGRSGNAISALARIVAVVNAFENLINDSAARQTPHGALKHMYAAMRPQFDARILSSFIHNMGVYPPGTIVELSNGHFGMVLSSTPATAARPVVLMHHPDIPKAEALMVDLGIEDGLDILGTRKPENLPRDVFAYLSPSPQTNYFAEAATGAP
jgi:putative nucleotidyltransferase with HDIG domain